MHEVSNQFVPVSEFMTPSPLTVAHDLRLSDARERMYVNNIRHLVVVRGKRVVGIISTRDIYLISSLVGVDPREVLVSSAMTRRPFMCSPETPVLAVARTMEERRYGCAVIVEGGVPIGIFTTTDALRALREVLAGFPAEPRVKPTHVVEQPPQRERIEHHVRASDSLPRGTVGPDLGRVFDASM